MTPTEKKFIALRDLLGGYHSALVAYSGGVDSAFLAKAAHDVLGARALAVIADSPSLPRRELQEALTLGETCGFSVRVVTTREMEDARYTANPVNRCYFCKHELFQTLAPLARAEGFAVICYGENASDNGDDRPGVRAAAEFAVRAPLKEVGLTKQEIRALSRAQGLATADKPQLACLSSRVPHGETVTPAKLAMIEAAENVLRDAGFYDVRVRHHELDGAGEPRPALARIELGASELPRLLEETLRTRVEMALRKVGYGQVTLDLRGYRRGGGHEGGSAK